MPRRAGARRTRYVRREKGAASVAVLAAKPKADKPAPWSPVSWSVVRPREVPLLETPVQPLHTGIGMQFVEPAAVLLPSRHCGEHGCALLGPVAGTPLYGGGAAVVDGPALPFSVNRELLLLEEVGHWQMPEPISMELLQAMVVESGEEQLPWSAIFNEDAPWASRVEDAPGRQVVYATDAHPLPALQEWGAILLGLLSGLRGHASVRIGTLGYIRTDRPLRQHLHRDLPLPAHNEDPGLPCFALLVALPPLLVQRV